MISEVLTLLAKSPVGLRLGTDDAGRAVQKLYRELRKLGVSTHSIVRLSDTEIWVVRKSAWEEYVKARLNPPHDPPVQG